LTAIQLSALSSNLKRVDSFISSCGACKENFYNLFCTFTCSPDQSLFVNITQTASKNDKLLVTELDNLWSVDYGTGFYESCKDVKFGATNSKAMSFIGGGAKNYTQFLKFLGDKKALGSPFQINFPTPSEDDFPGLKPVGDVAYPCNSTDPNYRCACVDCGSSCPELPKVSEIYDCHVGSWPCLSFSVVLLYAIFVLVLALAISGHVLYRKHAQNKNERLQLLQDTQLSDDEDDDREIVYQPGVLSRRPRRYYINTVCDRLFNRLGRISAQYPAITISVSVVFVAILSLGWARFAIETDPVRLWVSPDSAAAEEKAFFDANFGPFFRAEQAFLVNDTDPLRPGPVLSYDTLRWWFDVESRVRHMKSRDGDVTFDDVCYKPTGEACVVQSITGYFGGDFSMVDPDTWRGDLEACVDTPVNCLPDFQQPLDVKLLLGGWNKTILSSEALIVTWVVNNYDENTNALKRAVDWEGSLKRILKDVQLEAKQRGLRLSFNTESSLEEELNKSTNTDAKIVVISYIFMFLYASLALGSTTLSIKTILRSPTTALVQSKFMLGVVGIVIVLMSVSAAVGLFSAIGIKVTLIIAEVIPFLVLAVGVDNIFLIVHEFERVNASHPDESVETRIAKALGRMGPSILLSATMETVAFALGVLVGMPAVRNFAAYAAGAVFINALLQVTMFVSVLALNQRRVEAGRSDCFPCVRVKQSSVEMNGNPLYAPSEEGGLERFIRRTYAPALLGRKAKVGIFTVFLGMLTVGLALLPTIELGLDQRIAIPADSYLINYFNDLYAYFDAGPPVYFVTRELNVTDRVHQHQLCGRFSTCDEYSLANVLEQERKRPEISYIADATASWLDDYFLWLNPSLGECCVDSKTGEPCFASRTPAWNVTLSGMPEGFEFLSYLRKWLAAPTTQECPLAGQAAYSDALLLSNDTTLLTIPASHFRTAHTPLRSQSDFIDAYASARRITSDIEQRNPGISVFPYSKFYIFFDQYSSIVSLTMALLASAIGVCFLISSALLGSVRTGGVVALTVIMILVDIGGAMAVAGVSLNAVTLVNLVICVGIAVEFCAHIARAFQFPSSRLLDRSGVPSTNSQPASKIITSASSAGPAQFRDRDARAWAALSQVGGSVFSGITVTKLLGVCVLAFTRSKIFEVYYFRVWLALVLFAATHALVFLPVALSLLGGDGEFFASLYPAFFPFF